MPTSTQYKYFAFISYNHRDAKWAKWLFNKLEGYKLPTEIHNEIEASKYLRPIFRDKEELDAGVLSDELSKKLEASKFLIVICSPNSAKSTWVSNEVRAFIAMGRLENIIPFVIDGIPNRGDEQECFPTALREYVREHPDRELLGVNVNEVGKAKAVIRVISRMLEVNFDTLWKRHERARCRRIIAWTAGMLAVVTAIAGVWMANKPVDVMMTLVEASVHNDALPPIDSAVVSLMLNNEQKTATIRTFDETAQFANIPHKFIGEEVRVKVACPDFLDVDTLIKLGSEMLINMYRNPSVYGDVHFQIWNEEKPVPNVKVTVDGLEATSDAKGAVRLTIPLERQKGKYHVVVIPTQKIDTIWPPCGDDEIVSY